ncbi:helix-turn-helix domain-containing protein [Halorubrum ezzemoulense]|uniref:helix-turn-helix domain-containing protein n=1 Tax=Halorubrum ezzemoulense TaxID=337243 RepID=UPI00232C0236|nr:helix-turn-helix domain-containing protein [Halorubrum ezzemoulense]MDB9247563.1 helix-turn-helix domain-containing protein [Halorubrum ezzemoulense]MDB9258528.1 helix-turn-helix domain-containing protein [Halorubrum ezzemoulense]MDB9261110.1 helix-turn-helix domain-containing protein [Halorubrum ezzemoulense]MDB9264613.1 helix-turn-helix domain-containing protein [Halorubrum ezzemoulense]MDB9268889.1 helix-turn-helix domain-containing protein [Halorubrum ezzemoulense]
MKYLRLELRYPPELMHPMHRLVDESDAIGRDVLLHGSLFDETADTFLFYVEGDIDVYVDALRSVDRIREFEVTQIDGTGYYVFLTQRRDAVDDAMFGSLRRTGIVVVPPIDFRPSGVARLTILGDHEPLREGLAALPERIESEVLRIGEYDWRQHLFDPGLTDRQFDAVAAAVECGYYESPRAASVSDVAERIGASPSTASEHLRKAESAMMNAFMRLRDVA